MDFRITRVDTWEGRIRDKPGGLADKLAILAEAGANMEFVLARRTPQRKGSGIVFVAPIKGPRQIRAAKKARLSRSKKAFAVRIVGPDRRGLGAKVTDALAEAGLNIRGLTAARLPRRSIVTISFDSRAEANKAVRVLKSALG